jgi:hypothetical protein
VARHGKAVVPLLMALLSYDPHAERDRKRWSCGIRNQAANTGHLRATTLCGGDSRRLDAGRPHGTSLKALE